MESVMNTHKKSVETKYIKRTVKVVWEEDYYYHFRWFFSVKVARNWIQRELLDKAVCPKACISIVEVR